MTKLKSHAKWSGLSKKQRSTLEEWLFEERIGYTKAWKRAKTELGFTGSLSSLTRYYKRTADERTLAEFAESARMMASVNNAPVAAEELRSSGMKVATQVFFKLVTEKSEEWKAWLPLAKLLAQCEKNESWRAVKDEENEIRKATLKFAQIRYQYDVMGQALKALPELQEVRKAQEEDEMTVYDKNKRLNDLRRRMFGDVIPDLMPENEEEEAHPEIIVRRFKEGQRRQQEQFAREYRERQKEQAAEKARPAKTSTSSVEAPAPTENKKNSGESSAEANEGDEEGGEGEENNKDEEGTFTEAAPTKGPRGGCEGNEEREEMGEEPEPAEEVRPEAESAFVDEPRKLSREERQREYEELMRRARGR